MRKISRKRIEEIKKYRETKKELFLKNLRAGTLRCFFSERPIKITEELRYEDDDTLINMLECHHLNNQRYGDRLYDKDMLVPVLRSYHTLYHSLPVEKLLKTSWYAGFLERLKNKSEEVYNKELKKQDKI